jgi:acyl-coenzyme A thioesterase PaaI-like protein
MYHSSDIRLEHAGRAPPLAVAKQQFSTTLATMAALTEKDGTDLEHFRSIPWCAAYLKDPAIVAAVPISRHIKVSGEDNLFSKVLSTSGTISNFILFHQEPRPRSHGITELRSFLTLNTDVNGMPGVCHGGIVATIHDEVIGSLIQVNQLCGAMPASSHMTANLNTTYLRPVKVPCTIMVVARAGRVDGRKYHFDATIEDQYGTPLSTATALFIGVKQKL